MAPSELTDELELEDDELLSTELLDELEDEDTTDDELDELAGGGVSPPPEPPPQAVRAATTPSKVMWCRFVFIADLRYYAFTVVFVDISNSQSDHISAPHANSQALNNRLKELL